MPYTIVTSVVSAQISATREAVAARPRERREQLAQIGETGPPQFSGKPRHA
ncbi:hypothetical protein Bsp3421_003223 [Burkholderia sp. FERM BP-3421]|nr:hypothetical protein [Burkholderia sp. FERM BP-3421]WDD93164.1 hypothetical protein Bsp3421_003223 [Burkholderia sp. FERM BP-3421]